MAKRPDRAGTRAVTVYIPTADHRAVKILAAKQGTTVRVIVTAAIAKAVAGTRKAEAA